MAVSVGLGVALPAAPAVGNAGGSQDGEQDQPDQACVLGLHRLRPAYSLFVSAKL